MRRTAPKLILQGDKAKAIKWIPWATKALERIKNLTFEGVANKILRPVAGVAVHVWSANDIDRIRIVVAQAKGCEFDFTATQDLISPPYRVEFDPEFKEGTTDLGGRAFWLFGDNPDTSIIINNNYTHEYASAGDYTVIGRAWRSTSTLTTWSEVVTASLITVTINTGGASNIIGFAGIGSGGGGLDVDLYLNDVYKHTWTGGGFFNGRRHLFMLQADTNPMILEYRKNAGIISSHSIFMQLYSCTSTKSKIITVT